MCDILCAYASADKRSSLFLFLRFNVKLLGTCIMNLDFSIDVMWAVIEQSVMTHTDSVGPVCSCFESQLFLSFVIPYSCFML